jgi:hypothetical protein
MKLRTTSFAPPPPETPPIELYDRTVSVQLSGATKNVNETVVTFNDYTSIKVTKVNTKQLNTVNKCIF